jgi:flagellar biosynthesis protein FliR
VPQLNILSLGFPLRILVGLAILTLGLTVMNDVVLDEVDGRLEMLNAWVQGQEPS